MATKRFLFLTLVVLGLVSVIKGQGRGTVRLVRNGFTYTSYSSGRVQVFMNRWGYICDDFGFTITTAAVICHQLGYSGALNHSKSSLDSFGITSGFSFIMSDVSCSTSNYLVILQCGYSSFTSSCEHNRDEVSVTCFSTRIWDIPYQNQIRLSQGQYTSQGLVEVYCNGQWGTVCDDSFYQSEADTVCRQLGYTGAAAYDNLTPRGRFSQPIWLDDITCFSYSNCLRKCQSCPSYEHSDCSHSEDITVECEYAASGSTLTQQTCNYIDASDASDSTDFTSSTVSKGSDSNDFTSSTDSRVSVATIWIVVGVITLILPVAIPLSICACIVVAVTSTRRSQRRTAYRAVATSPPPAPPTVAVSTSMDSYQPFNQQFYPPTTHTPSTNPPPPPYTPRDPTSNPAHPLGDETPAVNPLLATSNVV